MVVAGFEVVLKQNEHGRIDYDSMIVVSKV